MPEQTGQAGQSGRSGLPDQIATTRLRLILVTPQDAADMTSGRHQDRWHRDYPRRDDVDAAAMVRADDTWGPRHVVLDGLAVGSVGFFGAPVDGEVEVGFGLVEEVRRAGVMTEALGALLEETDGCGVGVRASVRPENTASLRTLARCGFVDLRGGNEDGELVLARPSA